MGQWLQGVGAGIDVCKATVMFTYSRTKALGDAPIGGTTIQEYEP
ncbi:hypothetical protein CCHOA_03095 [Corynebacterium choanae]|uniref:Uncharacterized protein n=1 Tax=Corynebacterium choanae TaxID=1862358 RepID=A0A3G6J580_9CORY|nr:hypothetical protein CCHOA_03095 [Corynebacterium choanae]